MANAKKTAAQLGMPYGTASSRLRKMVMFSLLERHGENICFRCECPIAQVEDLSIEHKKAWIDVDPDLFWDLDNIAFSHLSCNASAGRRIHKGKCDCPHGSKHRYRTGCSCVVCRDGHAARAREWRASRKVVA